MKIADRPEGDSIRPTQTPCEFLWGCDAIANAIGRNRRVTFWLLEKGELKSPRKIRGKWMVARSALFRELGAV